MRERRRGRRSEERLHEGLARLKPRPLSSRTRPLDKFSTFLKIEMRSALPEKASVVPVAENIILDAATSKALGFKSVTVLRGEYKIDYSKNKLGSIAVNVEARN